MENLLWQRGCGLVVTIHQISCTLAAAHFFNPNVTGFPASATAKCVDFTGPRPMLAVWFGSPSKDADPGCSIIGWITVQYSPVYDPAHLGETPLARALKEPVKPDIRNSRPLRAPLRDLAGWKFCWRNVCFVVDLTRLFWID